MSPHRGFHSLLVKDVGHVLKTGFHSEIEPRRVPALAELAKVLTPGFTPYGTAVREVLVRATGRAAQPLLAVFPRAKRRGDVIEGLQLWLGVSEESPRPEILRDRMNVAGPKLGYSKGFEGLRHGQRNKTPVVHLVERALADELTAMGEEVDFTFAGTLLEVERPATREAITSLEVLVPTVDETQMVTISWGPLDAAGFAGLFDQEIERLYAYGLEYADAYAPQLTRLACHAFRVTGAQIGSPAASLRAFLSWLVDQVPDSGYRQATAELFGLNGDPGLSRIQRLDRAAPYLRLPTGDAIPGSEVERNILLGLTRKLAEIAVSLDFRVQLRRFR